MWVLRRARVPCWRAAGRRRRAEARLTDEDTRQRSEPAHEEDLALLARIEELESRVKRGAATLEDFGELARARQELARHAGVRERP